MKKTALAAALVLGASFGAAVQEANAYVYGRSYIDVQGLQLGAVDDTFAPADVEIREYVNTITNTSSLNGTDGGQVSATCTFASCPANTSPVLDANPSQIGAPAKGNNDFTFEGPDGDGEFARADGVVTDAAIIQIRDGVSPLIAETNVTAIAEAQLQTGETAASQSQLQSTTGLTISFTVGQDGIFFLNFDAVWDVLADIDTGNKANGASAQAEIEATATLTQDGSNGTIGVQFSPGDGFLGTNTCSASSGICTVTNLAGDLNQQYGTTSDPDSSGDSGSGAFGFTWDGLTAGDWTLVLNTTVRVLLTQDIPVPGTVALLGLGLTGLGLMGRRRKRAAAAA